MTKNLNAEKLYPWNRCIPEEERPDWELLTFNPDDFFGTSLLFRHRRKDTYAVGTVEESSNRDCFFEIPFHSEIFFAARQTEKIWILLAYDGEVEYMVRLRFSAGEPPALLNAEVLSSEVRRCIVNRHGHILIGYDNSWYFSDTCDCEPFPALKGDIGCTGDGQNISALPLLEWYDADGTLLHMFADNRNTVITELNIDSEDRALIALDLADPIVRLAPDGVSFIEKSCIMGMVIEGFTEARDRSGYLISFSAEGSILSEDTAFRLAPPPSETIWVGSEDGAPVPCRASCGSEKELPLDGYSCRANTILIEDDGWLYRIEL